MDGYWPRSFSRFYSPRISLGPKSKGLSQYPTILTSLLVKNPYFFSFHPLPPFLSFFLFGSAVSKAYRFTQYAGSVRRHGLWDNCSIYNVDCRDLLEKNDEETREYPHVLKGTRLSLLKSGQPGNLLFLFVNLFHFFQFFSYLFT